MKLISLALFLFTGISCISQNTWTEKAEFADGKRSKSVGFAIGDFGYVGFGEDTADFTHNDLWRYDPITDTWSQMMNCPGSVRRNAVATVVAGKAYTGTGIDSANTINEVILDDWWEYDPQSNSWTQKTSYPGGFNTLGNTGIEGVTSATAFSIDNFAYICAGKMGSDFYGTDLWQYDPNNDTWTRMADFPGGDRQQLSSFSLEGKGYVGLGIDHDIFRKDWWCYTPSSDTWEQVTSLPGDERGAAASFVLGQRGFIVFGTDGGYMDELWEFNPFSNTWTIKANFPPNGRKNAIAFAIGDKAYAGLGTGSSGKKKSFYEYTPLYPIGFDDHKFKISIYPNPIVSSAQIASDKAIDNYQIFSLNGELIEENTVLGSTFQVDRQKRPKGTYLLVLKKNDQVVGQEKLIYF